MYLSLFDRHQIIAAVAFRFIIHNPAIIGVNMVNTIKVNSLTINLIFNLTKIYINILITRAVAIQFPVDMLDKNSFPNKLFTLFPFIIETKRLTKDSFKKNRNFIKIGATAIATPPKQ